MILVLTLLACALLAFLRVSVYLRWRAEGARGRILRVARDGLLGGGVIGLLSLLSPGEPSIQPGLSDRLIGIGVLICLGVVNALAAYAFGSWPYDVDTAEQRVAVASATANCQQSTRRQPMPGCCDISPKHYSRTGSQTKALP